MGAAKGATRLQRSPSLPQLSNVRFRISGGPRTSNTLGANRTVVLNPAVVIATPKV